jgi:hypothetical protein
MDRIDVIELSAVRILDRNLRGGLGPGQLGVIMARAGAGKTALLCHLGLDALLRDQPVFHVALGDDLRHVASWYAALFDDLALRTGLRDADQVRSDVGRHRVIKTLPEHALSAEQVTSALAVFERHMGFAPRHILVDGVAWGASGICAAVEGLKALAARHRAALWITADTHLAPQVRGKLASPCDRCDHLIDVALHLESRGAEVDVEVLRGPGGLGPCGLRLETNTLRLAPDVGGQRSAPTRLPASAYTLLSGGAAGAEAEFGALAERHGVREMTFTFPGRLTERTRGLVALGEEELALGAVSPAWLEQHMRRSYPDTPLFRKVLSSIWHQVCSSGEVFAVGSIQPDGTVRGGTGWAVQLARLWHKPVTVFDQERRRWFAWEAGAWAPVAEPRITCTRFCGTGSRFIGEDARLAVAALFERSFAR